MLSLDEVGGLVLPQQIYHTLLAPHGRHYPLWVVDKVGREEGRKRELWLVT